MTRVSGFRCAVCGATVDIAAPLTWQCPNATPSDRRHVLCIVTLGDHPAVADQSVDTAHPNPFVAFRRRLAWDAFAESAGMDDRARVALIEEVDRSVARVAGTGFRRTPMGRADRLSSALGFAHDGGVWVKDETGNVAGSHKARHLFPILLHLLTAERRGLAPWTSAGERPPLAIASCGNAALAAATLAAAADWPIRVFVPPSASPAVVARLRELTATIVVCPRLDTDPPGDPCVHRFREAVAAGAVPFSVQGPENAWCLDGGRTIGWEILDQAPGVGRVFVQVGGGAFAACVGAAVAERAPTAPVLHAVQTAGCAPLARAWDLAGDPAGRRTAAARWPELMWPWDDPHSAADGILDDETYDWLGVFEAMSVTGGSPVVAAEATVIEAERLGRECTDIDASATGTAGLAGLMTLRAGGTIGDDERVAVVFSGVRR